MYTTVVSALLLDVTFLNVLAGEPWRRVLPTSRQQTVTRAYLRVILCGWGDSHPPGSLTVRAVHSHAGDSACIVDIVGERTGSPALRWL